MTLLTEENLPAARAIDRSDISEAFVDTVDTLWDYTCYGLEHGCIGHTFVVMAEDQVAGVLLLGEAIPWETDPAQMRAEPFYRLMGFVMDRRLRGRGLGGRALEMAIGRIYAEYGVRPIALGVHRDNAGAARFYARHGFVPAGAMEGDDAYYLRYP